MKDLKVRAVKEFFEEQFQDSPGFFLYKDKQLLERGKIEDFTKEQLEKANRVKWSFFGGALAAAYIGTKSLIEYGSESEGVLLAVGLFSWGFLIIGVIITVKHYYKLKSSIEMLEKIREIEKNQSIDVNNGIGKGANL